MRRKYWDFLTCNIFLKMLRPFSNRIKKCILRNFHKQYITTLALTWDWKLWFFKKPLGANLNSFCLWFYVNTNLNMILVHERCEGIQIFNILLFLKSKYYVLYKNRGYKMGYWGDFCMSVGDFSIFLMNMFCKSILKNKSIQCFDWREQSEYHKSINVY